MVDLGLKTKPEKDASCVQVVSSKSEGSTWRHHDWAKYWNLRLPCICFRQHPDNLMHPLNPINTSKGKMKEMNEKTILCEVHLFDLFLKGSSRVRDSNQSGYLFWQLLTTPKILLAFFSSSSHWVEQDGTLGKTNCRHLSCCAAGFFHTPQPWLPSWST